MTRSRSRADAAGTARFRAGRSLMAGIVTFLGMAVTEWRKLVDEVQDALSSHRRNRDAAERELFHGRYKLMSKNDDDLPRSPGRMPFTETRHSIF